MEIASFSELAASGRFRNRRTVLSIGVFEGMHRGHQRILSQLSDLKKELGADISAAITFSVNPKGRQGSLDTLRIRAEEIEAYGVDILAVIDFSPVFSKITACGFAGLLIKAFDTVGCVVGDDFRFGNPSDDGDGHDLERMLSADGRRCRTKIVDSVLDPEGVRISSSRIRQMIEKGELGCIPGLSGRFYRVDLVPLPYRSGSGELIISRASIHQLLPPPGAYDAALLLEDGRMFGLCAQIGGESLRLSAGTDSSAFGFREAFGKEALPLDSLYLEKRR